jgi:serine/threonine-protein kinase
MEPSNPAAQLALARVLFFRKEFAAFRTATERAISLNPMSGSSLALLGSMLAFSGDWERGCVLVERAAQLNPRHPGWYWFPLFYNAYRKGDYRGALAVGLKFNLPGYFGTHEVMAAAYGQLGEHDAASQSLRELLTLAPNFAQWARAHKEKWLAPELVEHVMDGLRKAGLEVADEPSSAPTKPASRAAGNTSSITLSSTPSIAVLPFANLSADKDQEYFSDGLTEEIINLLAHIPGLKVIARTSAFAFRGKEQDIRGIADALGVTHVLEGSVRRAGERIRVTAQLIHAGDGAHLWSERFDRNLSDVFAIQDEISQAISAALQVRLAPRAQAVDIEAYQHYLGGRYYVLRLTPESLEKGKKCLERALVVDPNYAPAYSALAEYYHCLWILGIKPISEIARSVKSAAEKALAIDPANSEAHSLLAAMAASFSYHWKVAESHHHQAMAAEPVPPLARFRYAAWYLLPLGRVAEAMEQSRMALETDPLNMVFHYGMALCLNHAKRYTETIEFARRALEIDPNSYVLWFTLGHAQLHAGLAEEAITSLQRVVELVPWWHMGVGSLAAAYTKSGDRERTQEWARKLTDLHRHTYGAAIYYAAVGEADAMFAALEEAQRHRDVFLLHIQEQPFFDPYRADPRFQVLLQKMNLA